MNDAADDTSVISGTTTIPAVPRRPSPRIWRHPHFLQTAVVEEADGQLWLVFLNRDDPWTQRARWTLGVDSLMPHEDPERVLKQIGFDNRA